MAALDKTYVSYNQYCQLKEWAKDKVCICHNGFKSPVYNWIYDYKESDFNDKLLPCWNTSWWQDRWLYQNCPLDFIQNRLKEQYGNEGLKELIAPIKERTNIAKHFKIIKKPQFNLRTKKPWFIEIYEIEWAYYDKMDYWTKCDEYLPFNSSCATIRNFNLRKFYRKLIKWKLPAGLTIIITGRYVGQEYIIKTYE